MLSGNAVAEGLTMTPPPNLSAKAKAQADYFRRRGRGVPTDPPAEERAIEKATRLLAEKDKKG